jgi:hypothetical protein
VPARHYNTERALCGTHRALLEALAAFELDLHQHIHEENNATRAGRDRELSGNAFPSRHSARERARRVGCLPHLYAALASDPPDEASML